MRRAVNRQPFLPILAGSDPNAGQDRRNSTIDANYALALEKATANRGSLSSAEVATLLTPHRSTEEMMLWQAAHGLRLATTGKCIHLRAIIEFSNYCRQDCLYCGLRRSNGRIARYRMTPDEMVQTAIKAHRLHEFGTFVLQSGEDPSYPPEDLELAGHGIKKATGAAVTLSIGEMPTENYRALREAGADRFLLKFETSDAELFRKLKPSTTLAHRLGCLNSLRKLGYQIGSGIILGLPGQNLGSIASDLLLCRDEDYEMVSIGPFISHPDTPLGSVSHETAHPMTPDAGPVLAATASVRSTITAVAVARLLVPHAHMPATTALGVIGKRDDAWRKMIPNLRDARSLALVAGANVVMLDVTPAKYRACYSIYPGKSEADGDVILESIRQAQADIRTLKMTICPGRGDSPKPPWGRGNTNVER